MEEELKDRLGRIRGRIKQESGRLVIYNYLGIRLGYYDGRATYDKLGRIVGYGNLLVLFLKDEFDI